MRIQISADADAMGRYAAERAAEILRTAIATGRRARLIVATGASQFTVLDHLTKQPDIAWDQVDGFHLDEYIGIDRSHPASFCGYLQERLVDKVPIGSFHFLEPNIAAQENVQRVGALVTESPIDVALVGIGENAHLAFNDPPADFQTTQPYLIVDLDEACRQQQVGEGWFPNLEAVPKQAISMSVHQILQSKTIICSVPDSRKAKAVRETVEGSVTPEVPASALQNHADCTLCLDPAAAEQLSPETKAQAGSTA
ncbi:MAG: glucosamine-6-phosphate deaminase [Pirellulaceae bacterium]